MARPRIYPPDVSERRKREQQRRAKMRDRAIVDLFRLRHRRLYDKALMDAETIVNTARGPLPGEEET